MSPFAGARARHVATLALLAAAPAFAQSVPGSAPGAELSFAASTTSRPGTFLAAAAVSAAAVASAPAAAAKKTSGKSGKARKAARPAVARGAAPAPIAYGRRDDVLAFAGEAAQARGLDRGWVEAALAQAVYQASAARLVMPAASGSAKNWGAYRARFVEPLRVRAGVRWWAENEARLAAAEARYGVPPEIVASIVGVETFYGRMTGSFRVLDALATLSFDFPSGRSDRSAFYRGELQAFLTWCALEGRSPDSVRGSFAGAIGWPQFMPGSILKYAVDFDHDGRVDLDDGGADVIGSVANYLAAFGWRRDVPATFDAEPPADATARATLLAPDIRPTFTAAEMGALGAALPEAARRYDGPLALVQLQNGGAAPSYVAGTANFYAVTRYNWSSYYALAVIDLASALRREKQRDDAARIPAR